MKCCLEPRRLHFGSVFFSVAHSVGITLCGRNRANERRKNERSSDSRIVLHGANMTRINTNDGSLKWDIFTSKRPGLSRDLPPGKEALMWVSNSSTLIYGERDAVLVDTLLTIDQSRALLNWVIANGRNLIAIYLTHGHGDHIFGLGSLLERFP